MLTQRYIKECLNYDPSTGVLSWRYDRPMEHFANRRAYSTWNARFAGKIAGSKSSKGYIRLRLIGKSVLAHRLAWCYVYGVMPTNQIDHIDGDTYNNKLSNLRDVTHAQNAKNQKRPSMNTSGIIGVRWVKQNKKWQARITIEGDEKNLGSFSSKSNAALARKEAEFRLGFHPNHGQVRPI